jgi:hypothetical protein
MDITYLPMRRGFVYLVAVLDWATRRVLAWRLSNTMTVDFCLDGSATLEMTSFQQQTGDHRRRECDQQGAMSVPRRRRREG